MIVDLIRETATKTPDKTAIVQDNDHLSYASFYRAIYCTRTYFENQKIPRTGTAVVIPSDLRATWVLIMALRTLGLNTIVLTNLKQIAELDVKDISCIALMKFNLSRHLAALANFPNILAIPVPGEIYADVFDGPLIDIPTQASGGHFIFSSGTTGSYKRLFWTPEFENEKVKLRAASWDLDENSILHCSNFGIWTGFGWKLPMAIWGIGGAVIFNQNPNFAQSMLECGANVVYTSPSVLKKLTEIHKDRPVRDKCRIVSGDYEMDHEDLLQATQTLNMPIDRIFSSTELNETYLVSRIKTREDIIWYSIYANRLVEIVDESDNLCPANTEGYLRVRLTKHDFQSYVDNPDASAQTFRGDYYYPGDLAVQRDDGKIRILGRMSNVINLHGSKVAVGPIELAIKKHLGVREICLFTNIDEAGREELIVAIEADSMPPQEKLDDVKADFEAFKHVGFSCMKQFPYSLTGSGKVRRAELKKLIIKGDGDIQRA